MEASFVYCTECLMGPNGTMICNNFLQTDKSLTKAGCTQGIALAGNRDCLKTGGIQPDKPAV